MKAKAKPTPTPRQKSELARRKAMGIAVIQSPLKFIKKTVRGFFYWDACAWAKEGDGLQVKRLARLALSK